MKATVKEVYVHVLEGGMFLNSQSERCYMSSSCCWLAAVVKDSSGCRFEGRSELELIQKPHLEFIILQPAFICPPLVTASPQSVPEPSVCAVQGIAYRKKALKIIPFYPRTNTPACFPSPYLTHSTKPVPGWSRPTPEETAVYEFPWKLYRHLYQTSQEDGRRNKKTRCETGRESSVGAWRAIKRKGKQIDPEQIL